MNTEQNEYIEKSRLILTKFVEWEVNKYIETGGEYTPTGNYKLGKLYAKMINYKSCVGSQLIGEVLNFIPEKLRSSRQKILEYQKTLKNRIQAENEISNTRIADGLSYQKGLNEMFLRLSDHKHITFGTPRIEKI